MPNTCSMGATLENETLLQLGFQIQIQMLKSHAVTQHIGDIGDQLFNSFWKFLDYIDQTIKWHPHYQYLCFTPNLSKQSRLHHFFGHSLPRAAHPHPDLFPSSGTLASDGIGASAKPGHLTTPAKHNMTSTVETCTMRKGRFSPQTKRWFSTEKQARTFFPMVFRCFGCKSALLSPLGCKR